MRMDNKIVSICHPLDVPFACGALHGTYTSSHTAHGRKARSTPPRIVRKEDTIQPLCARETRLSCGKISLIR